MLSKRNTGYAVRGVQRRIQQYHFKTASPATSHLRFVSKQPCLVCGRQPRDARHLPFAQSRGLGLKG
jgi:hypothetical protein